MSAMRDGSNWRRWTLIVLMTTLLGGCSLLRTAYDNLDWFVAGRAESYLDLDDQQYEWLRAQIRQWQARHAPGLLAAYDEGLGRLETAVADGLSREEAQTALDTTEALLKETVATAIPIMAELLSGLRPQQIDHLAEELEESNTEFRDKYLSGNDTQRLQGRADRLINRLETWTDSLDRNQRVLVREQSLSWPDHTAAWLAYRIDRQQGLLQALRAGAEPEQIAGYLDDWMIERRAMPADLAVTRAQLRQSIVDLLSMLDPSLDPEQREEVLGKIGQYREWIAEFRRYCGADVSC